MLYIRNNIISHLSIEDITVSILESIARRYAYSKDKKVEIWNGAHSNGVILQQLGPTLHSSQLKQDDKEKKKSKRERKKDVAKCNCLLIRLSVLFTLASSHCSTHRRFRGGSSSSESEGWGVGGRTGPASSSSFRLDLADWFVSFSPSRAATLNDNCSGSICGTKGVHKHTISPKEFTT
jgi:hypothetical protein